MSEKRFYVLQISNLCKYLSRQNVQLAVQSSELLIENKKISNNGMTAEHTTDISISRHLFSLTK